MADEITRDRPTMPDGYGVPDDVDGLIAWSDVEQRLVSASEFWMATVRPDGRPHVVPRWGVWLDGRLWYDGSPRTRHARNVRTNPACTLHLESGVDVVIIEGTSTASTPVTDPLGKRLSETFGRQYRERGYAPPPDAWSGADAGGLMTFTPITALAWRDFPTDVTRFRFMG